MSLETVRFKFPDVVFVFCRLKTGGLAAYRRFLIGIKGDKFNTVEEAFDGLYGNVWIRYPSSTYPVKFKPDRDPDPFHGYCIPGHGECVADDCITDHTHDWWALGWCD